MIATKAASSENERFLRDIVHITPAKVTFPARQGRQKARACHAEHYYQMCLGNKEPLLLGTWIEQCKADVRKCQPLHPEPLEPALHDRVRLLFDDFGCVYKARVNLKNNTTRIQEYLTTLAHAAPVHRGAAAKLRTRMDRVRAGLDGLDWAFLSEYPALNADNALANGAAVKQSQFFIT
ncbi:hypothetical protein B0H17DRAFT_1219238 [Mycena rosella]|uniref:Uncharacterized protein n=1 Tax=Mycena rosella TaxID=1033263 RepID=A0AAD7BJ43_MYCRO|nr:hypothetical protein B0H17DRAFT_1219238 [Mycena rosella]